MLIRNLKVSGLLSFGPKGIDIPLENLNVLIGPNGSGKTNLLEVLSLLKASPTNLPEPIKEMGGVREWLWKGNPPAKEARIEALIENPGGKQPLRHALTITDHGGRFEVIDESVENEKPYGQEAHPYWFYQFRQGHPVLKDYKEPERKLLREKVNPEQSILAQLRDAERYPALARLQEQYEKIRLFRNWSFGPSALLRREQSTQGRADFLGDAGENLAIVLSKIRPKVKKELLAALSDLYEGIEDFQPVIDGGNVLLYISEKGGREIPSTRLSDGTLRYLCLLAILLHPDPPPLIAIEEPELGLHPDAIPRIADLLMQASTRTQLVITTHSRMLVDALSDHPSAVIVCEKEEGESCLQRLEAAKLRSWLEKFSLGELWSRGELGGNRW